MNNELKFHWINHDAFFCPKSSYPAQKMGSNAFLGALGQFLKTIFRTIFGNNIWTIYGDVCSYALWGALGRHLGQRLGRNFWNKVWDEVWTRFGTFKKQWFSSGSITMHFLSWKLSSGLKSGSNAFWGALEGLAPPLSMTSPVLFALALTSLSLFFCFELLLPRQHMIEHRKLDDRFFAGSARRLSKW